VLVESLGQAECALMRACSDRAAMDCKKTVRPIYANTALEPRLKHMGSCTLLEVDGVKVLTTAAHTADSMRKGAALYVGGPIGTRPVHIAGGARSTVAPDDLREKDPFDFAFWVVSDDDARALGGVVFLGKDRLSHNRAPPERRYFMAYGYARSRNKTRVNHYRKAIGLRASRYTGTVAQIPELAATLGVSGNEHLFLHFGQRAETADGAQENSFGPVGLSGGGLFDLGDFTSHAIYADYAQRRAVLAGMLIEHHAEYHAVVAVKIGFIVGSIRRALAKDRADQGNV
jgi:hypothetical protein